MGWTKSEPSPAKGCIGGFIISLPMWLVILLLIWWIGA